MDRNRLIACAITEESEDEWLDSVIKRRMKTFKPGFNETDIGMRNSSAMFEVEEVRPFLHVIVKSHVAFLTWHGGLHNRNRDTRVASNIGQQPKDVTATEFCNQMLGGVGVAETSSASSKGLVESLIAELPMDATMIWKIVAPQSSVIFMGHGSKGRNIHSETSAVAANAMQEVADLRLGSTFG